MDEKSVAAITKEQVIDVLKTIEDPELFLDIWFLGLIYSIEIEEGKVRIEMTFTTPMCPAGPMLVDEVKRKVSAIEGASDVTVTVVFTPPWQPSDEVKGMLGML
jgi:metal-sulfur cluster biosynthetic enzyme